MISFEDVIGYSDKVIHQRFARLELELISGPVDRHGITEWVGLANLPGKPETFSALSAWVSTSDVIHVSGSTSVHSSIDIDRFESDPLSFRIDRLEQGVLRFILEGLIEGAVYIAQHHLLIGPYATRGYTPPEVMPPVTWYRTRDLVDEPTRPTDFPARRAPLAPPRSLQPEDRPAMDQPATESASGKWDDPWSDDPY